MTREHYWPQWLNELELRESIGHTHWISHQPSTEADLILRESQRPLSAFKNTLSRVCGPCNNGWMSRLQMSAKPLLTELINGRWPKLNRSDSLALAQWATMFAMVVEYVDPPTVAVSQTQRTEFMDSRRPPAVFKIWMGRFARHSNNDGGFYHRALVNYPAGTGKPAIANCHSNVFAIGQVLFFVISAQENFAFERGEFGDIDVSDWMKLGPRQLWPAAGANLRVPERLLDDVDYLQLATLLSFETNSSGFNGITGMPR